MLVLYMGGISGYYEPTYISQQKVLLTMCTLISGANLYKHTVSVGTLTDNINIKEHPENSAVFRNRLVDTLK